MSEWIECKLGELAKVQTGPFGSELHAADYVDSGIPSIMPKNIGQRLDINLDSIAYIAEEDASRLERYRVKPNDIVFSRRGDVEKCAFVTERMNGWLCGTGCMKVSFYPGAEVLPLFMAYFFSTKESKHWLTSHAVGTTMPNLNATILENFPVVLPPKREQEAIAGVLGSLDEKIDLLQRQNKTLEGLAQTLFRHWFVDGADGDWETKPLGDIANIQNGYAFSSRDYVEYQPGHLEVFKMGHIEPGGGLRFSPKKDYVPRTTKLMKWVMDEGDIVMAMTDMKDSMGILAHPAMIDKSNMYVLNQRVARIFLQSKEYLTDNYLLYLQLANKDTIALLQSMAHGGVQVNLSTDSIKSVPVIIPPKNELEDKFPTFKNTHNKMKANRRQIQTLEKLRDTLLPKLMSGEVRVRQN